MDTSKITDIELHDYKGFTSFNKQMSEYGWETLNEGFKYDDCLMETHTSPYLQKNPTMKSFFPHLNKMLSHLINSVKYLRNFNNYAVKKDYKRIN